MSPLLSSMAISSISLAAAATAVPQASDRKPRIAASVADGMRPTEGPATPLWNKLKPVLAAAKVDGGAAYSKILATGAAPILRIGGDRKAFNAAIVKAAAEICLGPFLVDEGASWVQFSWVCDVSAETSLSRYLTFKSSPELAVTARFEGSKIKELDAGEPPPFPGARRVSMNAAEKMQAQ